MKPEVQKVIEQKKEEIALAETAKKEREKMVVLKKVGLYQKDSISLGESQLSFSQEDCVKYPYSEVVDGKSTRYREIYPEITDEEFEALKQVADQLEGVNETDLSETKEPISKVDVYQSNLAKVLLLIAVLIYLVAFIFGFVFGSSSSYYDEFNIGASMIWWGAGFVSGTMMLGFANIVGHLYHQTILMNKIANKKE